MKLLLVALMLLVFLPTPAASPPPISLKINPFNGYEPLTVHVTITVEPDYQNRYLSIQWDSGEVGGYSDWDLDGQYAAKTQYYTIKGLPYGDYVVQATLHRVRGQILSNTQPIHVIETSF